MHKIDIFEVPDDFFTNGKTSGSRRPVNSTSHGREHLTVCACNDVHRPHIANVAMSDLLAWTAQTAIPTFFTIMYLSIFPIFSLLMMMMSRLERETTRSAFLQLFLHYPGLPSVHEMLFQVFFAEFA